MTEQEKELVIEPNNEKVEASEQKAVPEYATGTVHEVLTLDIEKEKKKAKTMNIVKNVLVYLFLTVFALFAILPFFWMIISSLKTDAEYRQTIPSFFPETVNWVNYKVVLDATDNLFGQVLINTIVIGGVSTILGVLVTIVSAFAFAKLKFSGKNVLFTLLLATMMIPGELFTTTNYVTVANFGWNNTYTVLILPFLVSFFYIYLLRNNMMQVPDSLYQAAKVDGAGDVRFLVKVMIPLTLPTIISITLLKFIGTWNSYIWPRLVNTDEKWQLLSNWVSGGFKYNDIFFEETAQTLKMAAACMVTLPLLIVFILFRKYIMRGVSRSGTKG